MNWLQRFWARMTQPDPSRATVQWINRSDAGVVINEDTAMSAATVWSCVRVICDSLGSLPWRVKRKTDEGSEDLPLHPADWLLYRQPTKWLNAGVWREVMLRNVLLWGNAYAEIQRDASNRPVALWPISPDRVDPRWVDGEIFYVVYNWNGAPPSLIDAENMFHLRGIGDELCGWSVLRQAANSIGLSLSQEQYLSSQMKNGGRPAGILTPQATLSKESAERIRNEWQAAYGGSGNVGKTALMSHGMTYTPMSMPNTDAELLASRKFSVDDICRWFRVPPHAVYSLERATFSNIEHQAIEFVTYTVVPWASKLEQEADRKLISDRYRGDTFTKLNLNALLRGDFETRAKGYQMLMDRGVLSVNDVLQLEDRNTIGDDGDKRFAPMNFTTLENLGEEPEIESPSAAATEEEPEQDEGELADRLRPVIRAAAERIVGREVAALRKSAERGDLERISAFYEGQEGYIRDQFEPLAALLQLAGLPTPDASQMARDARQELLGVVANGHGAEQLWAAWLSTRAEQITEGILDATEAV